VALTKGQQTKAINWFARSVFKTPRATAVVNMTHIRAAIDSVDNWLEAMAAGRATNIDSLESSVAAAFKDRLAGSNLVTRDMTMALLGAVALTYAGKT